MRTSLPVEQRIEMARKQQAARAAARLDREQARLAKEIERTERQEAARRDREARSQQMLEVSAHIRLCASERVTCDCKIQIYCIASIFKIVSFIILLLPKLQ